MGVWIIEIDQQNFQQKKKNVIKDVRSLFGRYHIGLI